MVTESQLIDDGSTGRGPLDKRCLGGRPKNKTAGGEALDRRQITLGNDVPDGDSAVVVDGHHVDEARLTIANFVGTHHPHLRTVANGGDTCGNVGWAGGSGRI